MSTTMLALKIKHKTALPSERLILLHIKRCDSCSVFLPSMFDGLSVCMRHESKQAQARAIVRQQLQEGG
jgi:hypothetical protein